MQYHEQEPWGEYRDDLRAAANTLWATGASPDERPNLMWPYFGEEDQADILTRMKLLDGKIAELKANGRN